MTLELLAVTPSFVGPTAFLLGTLLVILLALAIARLVFGFAWKLVAIGAVVLGGFWLLKAVSFGPPGLR